MTTTGRGSFSRNARAAANWRWRARCVRSPVTTTRSGRTCDRSANSRSAMVSSCRPKCRSEIWAMVFTTGRTGCEPQRAATAWVRCLLLRQRVADRTLDLERLLDGGARHHALVMRRQAGKVAGVRLHCIDKAPIKPEQMNVGDRIALDGPFPATQAPLGDVEYFTPPLGTDAPGRVDRRGDERHPRDRLRLLFETAARPQARLGETLGQIIQDPRDFGQRPAVDQQGRHLGFEVDGEVFRFVLLAFGERDQPALEIDADLV